MCRDHLWITLEKQHDSMPLHVSKHSMARDLEGSVCFTCDRSLQQPIHRDALDFPFASPLSSPQSITTSHLSHPYLQESNIQ